MSATDSTHPEAAETMTLEDFATRYKIGRTKTYAEVKAGRLKTFKVGRLRRTTPALAHEWLAARIAEEAGATQ